MRLLAINSVNYGSTGKLMRQIAQTSTNDYLLCVAASRSNKKMKNENQVFIGNPISRNISLKLNSLLGLNGCFNFFSTLSFIRKVQRFAPDIIHLHNLHNNYINLRLLFAYIKKSDIPVVWTLHDCWSFTGYCPHFTIAKCSNWVKECHDCPQYRAYPTSMIDRSSYMWLQKKKWFNNVNNLTIVSPSLWLADKVKQSFLKDYPIRVIHNGIDLSVFIPTKSDFKVHYHCENKHIILGVAFGWGYPKGLDVFVELSKRLPSEKYQIILVGTDDATDKQLTDNIISIHRTQNQHQLAEIYTAADLFVNPTREEVLGLVNIEALACGTPGVTFRTGGSPECYDENCGVVVDCGDVDALEKEIIRIFETYPFTEEFCLKRAQTFDMKVRLIEYLNIYNKLLG